MTNFEKIKQMSVEEMANYISTNVTCNNCKIINTCENIDGDTCSGIFKYWLENEVEE